MDDKPFDGVVTQQHNQFIDPVVVDVSYVHKGDRAHYYIMHKIKHHSQLQAYGATEKEAEESMHTSLQYHYGVFGYSINIVSRTPWKGVGVDGTACHDAPTK